MGTHQEIQNSTRIKDIQEVKKEQLSVNNSTLETEEK